MDICNAGESLYKIQIQARCTSTTTLLIPSTNRIEKGRWYFAASLWKKRGKNKKRREEAKCAGTQQEGRRLVVYSKITRSKVEAIKSCMIAFTYEEKDMIQR